MNIIKSIKDKLNEKDITAVEKIGLTILLTLLLLPALVFVGIAYVGIVLFMGAACACDYIMNKIGISTKSIQKNKKEAFIKKQPQITQSNLTEIKTNDDLKQTARYSTLKKLETVQSQTNVLQEFNNKQSTDNESQEMTPEK